MNKSILLLILLITGCINHNMIISSPSFNNNEFIPKKFTCIGDNINPELIINQLPNNTKSIALIMDDPDAPMGTWVHWVVWNIKPTRIIKENSNQGVVGVNSWGKNEYGGPCPPSGTHHYHFKVYALDITLNLSINAGKNELEKAMKGHVIESGELIGLFSK